VNGKLVRNAQRCGSPCCEQASCVLAIWRVRSVASLQVSPVKVVEMLIPILLVVALVLFLLAAFNVPSRVNLVALGLACVTLTLVIPAVH